MADRLDLKIMSSPILRLHSDAWEAIICFLSFESTSKLSVVHPQLYLTVRNRVKSVFAPPSDSTSTILDVGRIFRICERLPSIKELTIEAFANIRRLEEPLLSPGGLRTLTLLCLSFQHVIAFVLPLNLSELLPELLCLELEDYGDVPFKLMDVSIPPRLQVLKILPQETYPVLESDFVLKLPHTLTEIHLSCHWKIGIVGTNEFEVQPLTDYIWPPNLTTCTLGLEDHISLDHLPRTLTHLSLARAEIVATTFPQLSSDPAKIVFPWRQFFPLLRELHLRSIGSPFDLHRLLETIVLDTALDAEIVNRFISSSSWDIPSLRQYQSETHEPYPLFTDISPPRGLWDLGGDAFRIDAIVPFIQRTNFEFEGRMSLAKRFPAIEYLHIN